MAKAKIRTKEEAAWAEGYRSGICALREELESWLKHYAGSGLFFSPESVGLFERIIAEALEGVGYKEKEVKDGERKDD